MAERSEWTIQQATEIRERLETVLVIANAHDLYTDNIEREISKMNGILDGTLTTYGTISSYFRKAFAVAEDIEELCREEGWL